MCCWPAASTAPVRCVGCSLGCTSWLVLLFLSLLSFTCSCGGVVWSHVGGPSCCSYGLGSCGVSVPPSCGVSVPLFCSLGLWRTLSFWCFSPGFLPLELVRTWVGRLWAPSSGGTLLTLSWPVPTAWLSRLLVFLGLFAGVLSSRFQCLLIARGGCRWSLIIHPP